MTASGDEPLQMQFLYWGIAPLIALGAATWKAAGMRGSQHENWSARVTVLKTGLDEQAIQELESLRESIDELLGAEDDARLHVAHDCRRDLWSTGPLKACRKFIPMDYLSVSCRYWAFCSDSLLFRLLDFAEQA